ncbi:ATP-binding cassette domain-containing protein [Burkholderia sp. MSMB1498]|uniref:ATP-binding cassette domain-containing protein n=1 Tax=Burkholderia sp. MSMB1498 TaxID=1637842 RepID=UPI001E439D92|nr:ATP-binding cassette domain-containing protein [Burkholderia sp. MSMB1498]
MSDPVDGVVAFLELLRVTGRVADSIDVRQARGIHDCKNSYQTSYCLPFVLRLPFRIGACMNKASLKPVVATDRLTRRFGELCAVDEMTLSLNPGEALGLLGRNGAGKTTVIKMLTTLLPPTSGRATVAGFDIVEAASSVRREIGYVPQALSADGDLTGYENLLVFAKLYDIPRAERAARIRSALAFMELAEFGDKLVKTYSGGMIRRLEIAQSTLHRPKVLFLDEPTVGLDPIARTTVWEQVERLKAEYRSAILLTTHYLEEAERLCDRVAIMSRGRVTSIGAPRELTAQIGPGATFEDSPSRVAAVDARMRRCDTSTSGNKGAKPLALLLRSRSSRADRADALTHCANATPSTSRRIALDACQLCVGIRYLE